MTSLLGAFKRRARWIVLVPLVGVLAALALALILPDKYTAESTVQFGVAPVAAAAAGLPIGSSQPDEQQANTTLKLAKLAIVRERAAARLGPEYTAKSLKKKVKIEAESQTSLIVFSATARSADEAARIANAAADSFVDLRREVYGQQLATAVARLSADYKRLRDAGETGSRIRTLASGLTALRLLRATQTGDVVISERATPPDKVSAPRPIRYAIIGGFIGLILGFALAVVLEQLDRRLADVSQVTDAAGLPLLAGIPTAKELRGNLRLGHLSSGVRDAFQRLWNVLDAPDHGSGASRSFLVAGPGPGSGASTVASGLAASAAESGRKVLLLEADLRTPVLAERLAVRQANDTAKRLGLSADTGISALLSADGPGGPARLLTFEDTGGLLDLFEAGEPAGNPSAILGDSAMSKLLADSKAAYDVIVIDVASPVTVPDALPLIGQADGVVVVARIGHDTDTAVRELRAELTRAGAAERGVVTVGGRTRASGRS
ncbi:MAG: Wzz/FepE/Etk N-terminal domain-containing protein [Baekduia sp.]